jgi:hypothetical protein
MVKGEVAHVVTSIVRDALKEPTGIVAGEVPADASGVMYEQ